MVKQAHRELKIATRVLAAFRDYFSYLDRETPDKMRAEHARRLVQLHTHDYSQEWNSRIASAKTSLDAAGLFVRHLHHYTSSAVQQLKAHTRAVEVAAANLGDVTKAILKDERILRRYVGFVHRLRRFCAVSLGRIKESSQQDGAANGSQPIRSETDRTSSAAGSRR